MLQRDRARSSRSTTTGWVLKAASGGLGTLAFTLLCGCTPQAGPPPNLLMVAFDTTRADHLSCYGYRRETSPTVDALAEGGLLCEATFAPSSLTSVSASTFLTGVLPTRHGVRSLFLVGQESIAPDIPTLAERMEQAGYDTAGFVSAPPIGARCGLGRRPHTGREPRGRPRSNPDTHRENRGRRSGRARAPASKATKVAIS